MRSLLALLFTFGSYSASATMIKYQVDCQDVEHYGALSFNVKIWDEETINVRIYGHQLPSMLTRLDQANPSAMYELRFDLPRSACKFSESHPGVFSCLTVQEEALPVEIYDNANVLIGNVNIAEFRMALFQESRVGFPIHRGSQMERKGHQLELVLKDADNFKMVHQIHDYLYHGAPECKVIQ